MTILSDHNGKFNSKTTVISRNDWVVSVCSAKEGLLKGLSTIVVEDNQVVAKIMYPYGAPVADRHRLHNLIVYALDKEDRPLQESVESIIGFLTQESKIAGAVTIWD